MGVWVNRLQNLFLFSVGIYCGFYQQGENVRYHFVAPHSFFQKVGMVRFQLSPAHFSVHCFTVHSKLYSLYSAPLFFLWKYTLLLFLEPPVVYHCFLLTFISDLWNVRRSLSYFFFWLAFSNFSTLFFILFKGAWCILFTSSYIHGWLTFIKAVLSPKCTYLLFSMHLVSFLLFL